MINDTKIVFVCVTHFPDPYARTILMTKFASRALYTVPRVQSKKYTLALSVKAP